MFFPFIPLTTGSTGRRKLTQKSLMNIVLPLPPLKEQIKIISKIENTISKIDFNQKIITKNISKISSLKNSILRSAFKGKLVDQDPNDEPASVLLDRIKLELIKKFQFNEK